MLYVDSPVGTGFSYTSDSGGYLNSSTSAAYYLHIFLLKFFQKYPKFKKNDFYVFGESYGGKYGPDLCEIILKEKKIENLKGLIIQDGFISPQIQMESYGETATSMGFFNEAERNLLNGEVTKAVTLIKEGKMKQAREKWRWMIYDFWKTRTGGIDVYDVRNSFTPTSNGTLTFLNSKEARKMMHTSDKEFFLDNQKVFVDFSSDMLKDDSETVSSLLNIDNFRVLIYSGNMDFICTTLASERTLNSLNWKGKKEFNAAQKYVWSYESTIVGYKRSFSNLHFAVLRNAGHSGARDQQMFTRALVSDFINNKF